MSKGLLIVYTGSGKGKTTAALGLALRAMGHGQRVCMVQFVKSSSRTGEFSSAGYFKGLLDIHVAGRGFIRETDDLEPHRTASLEAWNLARDMISSGRYRMIILDEFTYVMKYGFIPEKDVIDTLAGRPEGLHIVVTGRQAPRALVDSADLVTEMKEIKHPYSSGIKAQQGIEF
ncbi:MAG TPA: cob(I)yrinic acid a,c-diamide adenosyltransferase [Thermodesulfobacteriaceae bacterium]|nr:cob(I)yrinic acid a,c-diamide adenosyltransferase [Thermodesulfobacteriaceae bacterium]